jgi:hypothetical protein
LSASVFAAAADDDADEAELTELVEALSPPTSEAVSQAANKNVAATIANMR